MDAINRWFEDQTSTPAGSLLFFILMIVLRMLAQQLILARQAKQLPKRKERANG